MSPRWSSSSSCSFTATLSSWDHFIATAVLYALCWVYSLLKSYFEFGWNHRALIKAVSRQTLEITIPTSHPPERSEVVFYARVRNGTTKRLLARAISIISPVPVFLESPYGGVSHR
ncbi:hypothetical protein ABZX51_000005 [Aspergillus tubingensis]